MNKFRLLYCTLSFVVSVLAGCAAPDVLPEILEYQDSGKKYDTTAIIEFLPYKDDAVNRLLVDCLKNNGYQVRNGRHYSQEPAHSLYILTVVDWSSRVYECEEGDYIDTRLIVMVRQPGVILDEDMHTGRCRYFQAYSQVADLDRLSRQSGLKLAVENLFLNDEFRSALEPVYHPQEVTAPANNASAQWNASLYFQQEATYDFYQALRFAFLAMQNGSKEAECYLAQHSLYGEFFGDRRQLVELAQKSAAGYYALGTMYEYGKGLPVDKVQAVLAYTKAAQKNNIDAQFALGRCYYYAIGVKKDYSLAHVWFKKAAAADHTAAKEALKNFIVEEDD